MKNIQKRLTSPAVLPINPVASRRNATRILKTAIGEDFFRRRSLPNFIHPAADRSSNPAIQLSRMPPVSDNRLVRSVRSFCSAKDWSGRQVALRRPVEQGNGNSDSYQIVCSTDSLSAQYDPRLLKKNGTCFLPVKIHDVCSEFLSSERRTIGAVKFSFSISGNTLKLHEFPSSRYFH